MKRVLLVAPHREGAPVLGVEREEQALRDSLPGDALEVTVMKGEVRLNDFVLTIAAAGCKWDIILFVAHGLPGLIVFSDLNGTPQFMASIIRLACPQVVLLSTCYSGVRDRATLKNIAEEISESGINVVAAIRELNDLAAATFDVEFIRALTLGSDLKESMDIALERAAQVNNTFGDAIISIPASPKETANVITFSDVAVAVGAMRDELNRIITQLDSLGTAIQEGNAKALETLNQFRQTLETLTIDHELQRRMMKLMELSQSALLSVMERSHQAASIISDVARK